MEKTMSLPQKIWKVIKDNPIVVLLVIVCIIVGCTIPNFFSFRNLNSLISNTTVRFLIALGVSGCLITKGTDLSAGRAVGLCACLAGTLLQDPTYTGRMYNWPEFSIPVAFLVVIAVGAAFGLVNGLIISKLNVPPFIATLGTQTIIYGICLVFTNAQPIGNFKDSYKNAVNGTWLKGIFTLNGESFPGIPYLLAWAAIFGLLFWFIYNKATHGKYMYAIGGNENAAEVSGVNTVRTKIIIYVTAGVMYAIAGFLLAPKGGGASSGSGMGYELEAIAGCTIGGVSTTGGIGTVGGVLVGVLVFELLKIVLQFLGVNPYYNYIVQGLVIVTAVAMDIRKYVAKK
ncbi:MAG: beta-methylgalactoside transporter [Oscillospiraceae bacterium]|nr:beta-methylgalactoside transporter [Oscillospiraceae bacterium]